MKKQDKEVILKWLSVNSTAYDDGVWSWEFRNMLDSLIEDDAYSEGRIAGIKWAGEALDLIMSK